MSSHHFGGDNSAEFGLDGLRDILNHHRVVQRREQWSDDLALLIELAMIGQFYSGKNFRFVAGEILERIFLQQAVERDL